MVILIKQKMKKQLLKKSENGLLIFKYFIPELQLRGDKCKNVHSPLYNDSNPSLSIFRGEDGIWCFKDFGDEEMKGDAFYFASLMWDLDCKEDFPKLMEELSAIDFKEVSFDHQSIQKNNTNRSKKESTFQLIERENGRLYIREKKYLKQFGITEAILADYNVKFIDGYIVNYLDGGSKQISRKNVKERIMLAYVFENFAKIYVPFAEKKDKFRYVGTKPDNYVFGNHLIEETDKGVVFLAAGEKDVMTIAGLGYRAICVNSETSTLSKDLLKEIYHSGLKLLSLYDFDKTGRAATENLQQDYGIPPLLIPTKYQTEGKDISDFVMAGMTKEQFDKRVNLTLKKIEQENSEVAEDRDEEKSPFFEDFVYDHLPVFFKDCVFHFKSEQEKSLILLSSLVMAGGALSNVRVFYDSKLIATNLFLLVVAPAASGKGIMNFARNLGSTIHKHHLENNKNKENEEQPFRTHFIPANNSSSSIISQLSNNDGIGTIFDTEADTLGMILGREWGDFSDLLRKGYSNELYDFQRKTNNEYKQIEYPQLTVILSGTPGQVPLLLKDVENGLFSRFTFFNFSSTNVWNDQLHVKFSGVNIDEHFSELGLKLFQIWESLRESNGQIEVCIADKYWEKYIHPKFIQKTDELITKHGNGIKASLFRMGNMVVKLISILTIVRHWEQNKKFEKQIHCIKDDVIISILMAEVLIFHTENIYNYMGGIDAGKHFSNEKQRMYYTSLPVEFDRKKANAIGKELSISVKTIDGWLNRWVKIDYLNRSKHACYRKN